MNNPSIMFRYLIGQGTVLLVNDVDDFEYYEYYLEALQNIGVPFAMREIEGIQLPFSDNPLDYSEIIWFTGASERNTLTSEDQEVLKTHLDSGGRLLLSGCLIGHDIGNTSFYKNYLHSNHISFITMLHTLNCSSSNPVFAEME